MTAHSPLEPDEGDVGPKNSARLIKDVMHVTSFWFPGSILGHFGRGELRDSAVPAVGLSSVCLVTGNRQRDCTYGRVVTFVGRRDICRDRPARAEGIAL